MTSIYGGWPGLLAMLPFSCLSFCFSGSVSQCCVFRCGRTCSAVHRGSASACLSDGSRRRERVRAPSVGQPCRGISTRRRRVRVSTFADNMSPNTYMAFRQMSALTSTSKAFRARLQLRENEVPILQMWAARNCALHTCFGSDHGTILLIALRATPQTSASFARTLRNALRRTGVSTAGLRGHWLFLISEREAISVCVGNAEHPPEPPRAVEQHCTSGRRSPMASSTARDADARVVELPR